MANPLSFPFAAVLLAAVIPLWQFWLGVTVFPKEDVLRPAIALALAFGLIVLAARLVVRDWHKAGLLALIPLIVVAVATKIIAVLAVVSAALVLGLIVERGSVGALGTMVLNIFALAHGAMALYLVAPALFVADAIDLRNRSLSLDGLGERPSIVHIVLDGYSSRTVLEQVYGHDNAAFETALERRGFTVMKQAFSPSNQTLLSLAAVLNGDYLEPADLPAIDGWRLRLQLGKAATAAAVPQALRAHGYRFAYAGSNYGPLQFADDARPVSPASGLNSIESSLIGNFWPGSRFATMSYNGRVRDAFRPGNLAIAERPFFYFQHVLSPHPPFSLTADGADRKTTSPSLTDGSNYVQDSPERRGRYVAGYVEKLKFTNRALLDQLEQLPEGPLVVIVHGDHGGGALFDFESLDRSCALERFSTLLAVYSNVPRVQRAFAERSDRPFNLANIYRVLFAALSETEIAELPDVSYFSPWSAPHVLQRVPTSQRAAACDDPSRAPTAVSAR